MEQGEGVREKHIHLYVELALETEARQSLCL